MSVRLPPDYIFQRKLAQLRVCRFTSLDMEGVCRLRPLWRSPSCPKGPGSQTSVSTVLKFHTSQTAPNAIVGIEAAAKGTMSSDAAWGGGSRPQREGRAEALPATGTNKANKSIWGTAVARDVCTVSICRTSYYTINSVQWLLNSWCQLI